MEYLRIRAPANPGGRVFCDPTRPRALPFTRCRSNFLPADAKFRENSRRFDLGKSLVIGWSAEVTTAHSRRRNGMVELARSMQAWFGNALLIDEFSMDKTAVSFDESENFVGDISTPDQQTS